VLKSRFVLEPQSTPYATGILRELGRAAASLGPSVLRLWDEDDEHDGRCTKDRGAPQ